MKIVKKTASELRLQDSRLIGWTHWILGAILTLLGLELLVFVVIGFVRPISLTCQRTAPNQGNCELVRLDWSLESIMRLSPEVIAINIPLSKLQGAKVKQPKPIGKRTKLHSNSSRTYQVILLTPGSEIPFAGYYTNSYQEYIDITTKINQFVKKSDQSALNIKHRHSSISSMYLFMVILFPLLPGLLLMSIKIKFYTFDKNLSKLVIKQQNAFGANFSEHQLSEIVDVMLEEETANNKIYYKPLVLLASGDRLIILKSYKQDKDCKKIVDRIRSFLNLQSC